MLMKKSLLLLILFFFSCKSDDKCGEIFDKISTSDQYICGLLRDVTVLLPAIFKGVCKVMSK